MDEGDSLEAAIPEAAEVAGYELEYAQELALSGNTAAGIAKYRKAPACSSAVASILSEPLTRYERRSLLADIARPSGGAKDTDRITAIKTDGQMEGDFVERKQVDARLLTKDMGNLSDEQLIKVLVDAGVLTKEEVEELENE